MSQTNKTLTLLYGVIHCQQDIKSNGARPEYIKCNYFNAYTKSCKFFQGFVFYRGFKWWKR